MGINKSIIEELNTLPKGYISTKRIHGKNYSYLQYDENGKLKSLYVRASEADSVRAGLARRKEIEQELKAYDFLGRNINKPSRRSRELTGSLMMGDTEVAGFDHGVCVWKNEAMCPLYIRRTSDLSGYLASRAIDRNRTNSRLLKKLLDIHESEDDMTSLYSFGATLTDNYWFRVSGSKLKYKDISFTEDYYSDVALKGEILYYPSSPKHSPQLTLTGSYEKCWKRINGEWWLYKKGTDREIFSELFCSGLAGLLHIPTAVYKYDDGYIRTRNFADTDNLEPMLAIAGEDDRYEKVFTELDRLSARIAKQYLKLMWFDLLVNNVDRHNENCGLMRSRTDGRIIGLAPNYDNNLALISRTEILNMDPSKDGFIKVFAHFIKNTPKAEEYLRKMQYPKLERKKVERCIEQIPLKFPQYDIAEYIMKRYEYLKTLL